MANTKCIGELEQVQNDILEAWNCHLEAGIKNGFVNLEDGIPWLEIVGDFNKEKASIFAQELANALDVIVLFNRLQVFADGPGTLYLALDINPDEINEGVAVPPYVQEYDEESEEFFYSYGKKFKPSSEKNE